MILDVVSQQFDDVLRAEHLYDVAAVFGNPAFFDEMPLYARFKQIAFLKDRGDVDAILLELSLAYLDRVVTEVKLRFKRFAAITISPDDGDYIVPSIFVCNSNVRSQLADLRLTPPEGALSQRISGLVQRQHSRSHLGVFEDHVSAPDFIRVFIGYKSAPKGLFSLGDFVGDAHAHRQVG